MHVLTTPATGEVFMNSLPPIAAEEETRNGLAHGSLRGQKPVRGTCLGRG